MKCLSLTHFHFWFFFVNYIQATFAAYDFAIRITLFTDALTFILIEF